jgi:hypothetical protein
MQMFCGLDVLLCSYLRRLHKEHKIRHKIEIGGRKLQNDRETFK